MKLDLDDPASYVGNDDWFVISATREDWGPHHEARNMAAHRALWHQLARGGHDFRHAKGAYKGIDQGWSFVVRGSEAFGRVLAHRYGQESILTHKGLVARDGSVMARWGGLLMGAEAMQQEFYTKLAHGALFSVQLDWPEEERQFCDDFSCVGFTPEPRNTPMPYFEAAAEAFPADPHALLRHVEQVLLDWAPSVDEVAQYQAWHKLRRGLEEVAKHRVIF